MTFPVELQHLLPAALQALCVTERYTPGETLFLTGDRPRWMYFVSTGEVVLERHGIDGQIACLQRCQQGFVGQASLTAHQYHCHGRILKETALTRVPIEPLRLALAHDGLFAIRWIEMLNQEVRTLRQQNERLSLPKVQDRFLHLIETEAQSGRYVLHCSVKELAKQLAVTHEALYRAIAQLIAEGLVGKGDGCFWRRPLPVEKIGG